MKTAPTPASPQHLLGVLRSHVWFASCPAAFQTALIDCSRVVHLKPGDRLFSRGESDEALCCVLAGALKIGSFNPNDDSQVLTLYVEPYHWFGEVAMIDSLPRSQDAVADVVSAVLVVSRSLLEPWLAQHPQHWRDVARLACYRLRMTVAVMEDNATLALEQKLARRLLMTATSFGMNYPMSFRRHLRLPQAYLARMMGVSRQTVNRALRVLADEGIIVVRYADIELVDIPALANKAGPMNPGLVDALRVMGEAADQASRQCGVLPPVA